MLRNILPMGLLSNEKFRFYNMHSLYQTMWTAALITVFFVLLFCLVLYKVLLIASAPTYTSLWTLYGIVVSIFLLSRIPYAYLYDDTHSIMYADAQYPPVSVIVAAKNEEGGIYRTIAACLESGYPGRIECIVIDDGSTDGTRREIERARQDFGSDVYLIIFPENRGKREAMAAGMLAAQFEIFIFVDSDSYLKPDAIRHITEHFMSDIRIGAVSGNTKVENKDKNMLTRMQSIQYAISFDVYKASESVHQSVTCCPGCFSAYRRLAVRPLIQEWKNQKFLGIKGTFGDDRSLTNFVLKSWNVVYCERARATTNVPERFKVYWKQQLRWKKSWIREGVLAGLFMWRRSHILASIGFYIHFSFPFLGPILAFNVLMYSIVVKDPFIFLMFVLGFMMIGFLFSLFVRLYRNADNFFIMPLFSVLFVTVLIWQMPFAILTVRKGHWGTR